MAVKGRLLTDVQWERVKKFIPERVRSPRGGRPPADDRDCFGHLDWQEVFVDGSFAPAKKGGAEVGKTKRGKGTKWMVVADGTGVPVACTIASASPSEVTLVEETLETVPRHEGTVTPLIADRGYDSDPLRERLMEQGWDLICPHRRGRVRRATQDGRKLRRYKRRWKVERNNCLDR